MSFNPEKGDGDDDMGGRSKELGSRGFKNPHLVLVETLRASI